MRAPQTTRCHAALKFAFATFFLPAAVSAASPSRNAAEANATPPARSLSFNRDIRPILSENCFSCHGPDPNHRKAGLRLDVRDNALRPAESGSTAIVPRKPEASELLARIHSSERDEIMPPPRSHKRLTPEQKSKLRQWIQDGAPYEPHWAFIAPQKPPVPVAATSQERHPIDAFLRARLREEGLRASPEADRPTLIRRVTLDLTGLPPTPEEVSAFTADTTSDAYERLVDRLMQSHAYAERRAQEWLDLARYADTCGFADDGPQDMWPFRDWVVEAIHRNQPFDQFTIEQLAGDMLPESSLEQRIATGFHRNAPQAKGNTYPVEEYRIKGVVDRVNTTGKVWFGLSVGCAECHDHKFDPLSQREYYSLFALFNNVEHSGIGFNQGGPLIAMPSEEQAREIERLQAEAKAVPKQNKEESEKIKKALETAQKKVLHLPVMREIAQQRPTFVHIRGNFLQKGEQVEAGVPALFLGSAGSQPRNRLDFARWLVNGKNPLVARVAVNRFWQEHFGSGLVRTPDDFGLHGEPPSHPELLDWLACEFVESGWDMKYMHRLIVTSAAYKQSSRVSAELLERDPQNILLARAPRPRLAAEQIRDQALAVSGLLEMRAGGPPVFPVQPAGYWQQRALKGTWQTSKDADLHRRTLYTYWRRMALHPSLELLDAPSRAICVARRTLSNVPTQALVLLNDPLFLETTRAFAKRLLNDVPANAERRLERAFQLLLARGPDADEKQNLLGFVEEQTRSLRGDHETARSILGEPADPSPQEGAAWTLLAGVLLNLDETIVRP